MQTSRINCARLRLVLLVLAGMAAGPARSQADSLRSPDPYKVNREAPRSMPGMRLVWNEEFDKEGRPDSANWGYELGFVRNRELQWYTPENVWCRDGRLVIEGRRERVKNPRYDSLSGNWRRNRKYAGYTSSCLFGRRELPAYGYFEVRARIDTTQGAWPAIWMLGSGDHWPRCGEIDLMEFYRIRGTPTLLANVAWGSERPGSAKWDDSRKPLADFLREDPEWPDKYHEWSMYWDRKAIRLYLDGRLMNETLLGQTLNPDGSNPFIGDRKYYLLLNLALGANGGHPSGKGFPVSFEVDYVRVYRPE